MWAHDIFLERVESVSLKLLNTCAGGSEWWSFGEVFVHAFLARDFLSQDSISSRFLCCCCLSSLLAVFMLVSLNHICTLPKLTVDTNILHCVFTNNIVPPCAVASLMLLNDICRVLVACDVLVVSLC